MAAIVKGTAHLYGIAAGTGAVTNATVQGFTEKADHQNKDNTVDEVGNEIERRRDDLKYDAQIEIKIRASYTQPTPGDILVYNGVSYEIDSIDKKEVAKGFRIMTLNLMRSQYIAYT